MRPRSELSTREVQDLHEALMRRLGDSSVPTLPEVAVKVIQLVSNPGSGLKDFVEVIQTDQALTARLLRTANSALFAQRQPVTQLQRAMVLLGLDRLKAMALGFHLSQAAAKGSGDGSIRRVWTMSLFRAWTAFRVAEYYDRTITGEAFIIGLLQDAGVPMMPKLAGEEYERIINPSATPLANYQAEMKQLPFTHADLIAALGKMWKLPDLLALPIMHHHVRPDRLDPKNSGSILQAVSYFVSTLSLGVDIELPGANEVSGLAKNLLKLEPSDIQKMLRNAAADFKSSREFFQHVLDDTLSIESIVSEANKQLLEQEQSLEPLSDSTVAMPAESANRFESGGLVLEMIPAGPKKITFFIADAAGNRLLSEDLDPTNRSRDDLRRAFMLDGAEDSLLDKVIERARALAA